MSWRVVHLSQAAHLAIKDRQLQIRLTNQPAASIPLEDIAMLVLEAAQITLTQPLLCSLADQGIGVLTIDAQHLPNGLFLPYLPFHRPLQRLRWQINLHQGRRKNWHKQLIQQKINNQVAVLQRLQPQYPIRALQRLADNLKPGDPDNYEAQAARWYFQALWGRHFQRSQTRFYNAAINYTYAVIRALLARCIVACGLHPSLGLFHDNEQNPFNLADDLIEPYRPLVDYWVCQCYPEEPEQATLHAADKRRLLQLLTQDISNNQDNGRRSLLAATEELVASLIRAYTDKKIIPLWLPVIGDFAITSDE